jgi:CTP:molybdopterin cytidylyltransferase MocA
MKAPRFVGLILAAGRGDRLGKGPKAFVKVGDETLLERAVRKLNEAGVDEIVAVLPSPPDKGAIPAHVGVARNPIPDTGPLRSAQIGLQLIEDLSTVRGVVLYPVDHHRIDVSDIEPVLDVAEFVGPDVARVVPSFYGTGGHPIVIAPAGILAVVGAADPENDTLRDVLSEAGTTRYIEAGGEGVLLNLNKPEDLNEGS